MTWDATGRVLTGFKKLITGEVERNNISGPIGIAVIAHKALQAGWEIYLGMLIMISINLGILNLLPIPVLDGGHLVFLVLEALRGRPLSPELRLRLTQVGFYFLMALMLFVVVNDVLRLTGG